MSSTFLAKNDSQNFDLTTFPWSQIASHASENVLKCPLHNFVFLLLCTCYVAKLFSCTDTLILDPVFPESTLANVHVQVEVTVEVVKADGLSFSYQIKVPSGSSLLESLTLLQQQQTDFKSVSFKHRTKKKKPQKF